MIINPYLKISSLHSFIDLYCEPYNKQNTCDACVKCQPVNKYLISVTKMQVGVSHLLMYNLSLFLQYLRKTVAFTV